MNKHGRVQCTYASPSHARVLGKEPLYFGSRADWMTPSEPRLHPEAVVLAGVLSAWARHAIFLPHVFELV